MTHNYDPLQYYHRLNVPIDATMEQIKKQYYILAKELHPDHNSTANAMEIFQKLSEAYEILSTPSKRLTYNLLSCVYNAKDFPLIGSLKIYKNQADKDDPALRILCQRRVFAGYKETIVKESKDICNMQEAGNMVLTTSIFNWLRGWWGKDALRKNIAAIKYNLQAVILQKEDNLKLWIHNAVAYKQENNDEMAWIYAQQARLLVTPDSYENYLLQYFCENLTYKPTQTLILPKWNEKELQKRQKLFPLFLLGLLFLCFLMAGAGRGFFSSPKSGANTYYEVRNFGGYLVPSDMIENKIIKTDSNIYSRKYLMHFKKDCVIYYGPDSRYSPLTNATQGMTVRISGYTAGQEWYQIIIDNGEKGYTARDCLEKGSGNPIPPRSQVYKEIQE